MLDSELLTIKDVLDLSGVSRYTLHRDIKSKKIPAIYFGRNVRFKREDAEAYAEKKKNSKWVNTWKQKNDTIQPKS